MFTWPLKHLRTKLLVSMLAVISLLTAAVLVLIQARMRSHVREDLVSTLRAESGVYLEIERAHREQTQQAAALIADQPSLKALMSTNDAPTVQDGSESFLLASRADLLILQGIQGSMLAFHSKSADVTPELVKPLLQGADDEDWWFIGGHLYNVYLVPIVAGASPDQRFLGRMAVGREIKRESIVSSGAFGRSAFAFERQGHVLLSSLGSSTWSEFEAALARPVDSPNAVREIDIHGEQYLASFAELPADHPVRLYCLQSYDQATSFLHALNRMLLVLGAVAVLAGTATAFVISRQITKPIEHLAVGTQQLKKGDFDSSVPVHGADEVADLGRAFNEMRESLKKSRDGLLRSARLEAVGRLAGGVAHDFNNLVMIIKGYSDMLLDSASPEARPHLEEIKRAGDRATALTRQLLAFSRKQILEPQVLDPNQIIRNMVKMLGVLIGEDIEMATHFSDQLGRIQADPGQLEQVVMNLVVNARDAMPNGGKLVIETQACHIDDSYAAANPDARAGDHVLIAVTDNGCGMSHETQAHIFEPFFTTKEPGKGTGLGLATVYGIVKQSRGHITVYSEVGVGTTFKVYFPALDKSAPLAASQAARTWVKGTGTILLAEDEPALRKLTGESLKKLGYTVLTAKDGVEALALAEHHTGTIDVVVADIVMPKMGGPELVSKLRQAHRDFDAILVTGYTEASALENAKIESGAVLLSKPFSVEVLSAKISELRQKRTASVAKTAGAGSS